MDALSIYNGSVTVSRSLAASVYPNSGTSWSIDLSTGNTQQFKCGTGGATVTVNNPAHLVAGELVTLVIVQNGATACKISTEPSHIVGAMTINSSTAAAIQPAALWMALVALAASCGGGAAPATHVPTGGTPAGTYKLTVTATSGNLSQSNTVTLTVQ